MFSSNNGKSLEISCTPWLEILGCAPSSAAANVEKNRARTADVPSRAQANYLAEELLEDLELVLAAGGLEATVYIPSKDSSATARKTFIKSKRDDTKIEFHVVVDSDSRLVDSYSIKKLKFKFADVVNVNAGRAEKSIVPAEVPENLCMHFTVRKKGDLHVVFESPEVCADAIEGTCIIVAALLSLFVSYLTLSMRFARRGSRVSLCMFGVTYLVSVSL